MSFEILFDNTSGNAVSAALPIYLEEIEDGPRLILTDKFAVGRLASNHVAGNVLC